MPVSMHMQIAADNAVFGQTGPKVGSFDAGYGSTQMARIVGEWAGKLGKRTLCQNVPQFTLCLQLAAW